MIYNDTLKEKSLQNNFFNLSKLFKKYIFLLKLNICIWCIIKFFSYIINQLKANKTKICLCTLGKNENKYITEFVEHYKKYGVDKIFIYDNNNLNGERFEEVIMKYIENGFVEIRNWRGIEKAQFKIMKDCYETNFDKFDWLIFYDIDEFIYLKYFKSIKAFLSQSKFNKCKKVELNWIHKVEKGISLYYDNRPLKIRFNKRESNIYKKSFYPQIKSIIRGNIKNITFDCVHLLAHNIKSCDGFGRLSNTNGVKTLNPDFKKYYINHYYGKSLQEFVEKILNGCASLGKTNTTMLAKINRYFEIYNIDKKKIDYIENKTGLDLSFYKAKVVQRL